MIHRLIQIPRNKGSFSALPTCAHPQLVAASAYTNGPRESASLASGRCAPVRFTRDRQSGWLCLKLEKSAVEQAASHEHTMGNLQDPEPPSRSWCLSNNVSHTAARRINLSQRETKLTSRRCYKRAYRETWVNLVDRDRFLSPESVSMKPQDRAGFSSVRAYSRSSRAHLLCQIEGF